MQFTSCDVLTKYSISSCYQRIKSSGNIFFILFIHLFLGCDFNFVPAATTASTLQRVIAKEIFRNSQ